MNILAPHFCTCTTCAEENAQLKAEIAQRDAADYEIGFGVLNASAGLIKVRQIAAGPLQYFDAFRSDIKDLKLWNSATGHQPRTDEFYRPALAIRTGQPDTRANPIERRADPDAHDLRLVCKTEFGGDGLLHLFQPGTGWSAMERILAELKRADVAPEERNRYIRLAAQKRYGPALGLARALLYHLGWQMLDHPTMTVVGFEGVASTRLEEIYHADRDLFIAKRQQRDRVILRGVLA